MYDHHLKAGNPGDVIKHIALIAAAGTIMARCRGSFCYADIFAGYAWNPLSPGGEWQNGIGAVYDYAKDSCNSDLQFWRGICGNGGSLEGSLYPGSSIFVRELCRQHGFSFKPRLWDISAEVISDLTSAYSGQDVEIFPRAANLDDFPNRTTDLLLIDPPGYEKNAPYLGSLLRFYDIVDNVILWLPITTENGTETEASEGANREYSEVGLASVSVIWGGERSTKGCRLAYRLPDDAGRAVEKAVCEIVRTGHWAMNFHQGETIHCP